MDQSNVLRNKIKQLSIEITYEQFGKQNRLKPRIRCADDVWANSKLIEVKQ